MHISSITAANRRRLSSRLWLFAGLALAMAMTLFAISVRAQEPAPAKAPDTAVQGTTATPVVDNATCLECHEDVTLASGHSPVKCASCHQKHEEYPHPEGIAKPKCESCHKQIMSDFSHSIHAAATRAGREAPDCYTCHDAAHDVVKPSTFEFRKALPATCSACHSAIDKQYEQSVHGKALSEGVAAAPNCTSCHGEHNIRKPSDTSSTVNALHVRETCGQCHGNVRLSQRLGLPSDRVATFDKSFHGMALKGGAQTVANCASCHGVHDILPSTDPRSSINPKNLPKTCGGCHPGAGVRFAIGKVHRAEGEMGEPPMLSMVRWFYVLAIPLILGFMFVHNLGDWLHKLIRLRRGGPKAPQHAVLYGGEVRMYPLERLQHVMLAVSFIVLSWSGFALVWPDQWWAAPLTALGEAPELRRNIHRIAAVVFIAASLLHLVLTVGNKRLRRHWMTMIPTLSDVVDAGKGFAYNVGLLKKAPKIPSHSYIEKAEYWAVVWGGVLMTVTGLMLWANNISLRYMPKAWLDIATAVHWYEAVLAASAIVIWHFYSVIFDPDVYPLDTAFVTGRSARKHPAALAGETQAEELGPDAESETETVEGSKGTLV